jgi:hypothetical protein
MKPVEAIQQRLIVDTVEHRTGEHGRRFDRGVKVSGVKVGGLAPKDRRQVFDFGVLRLTAVCTNMTIVDVHDGQSIRYNTRYEDA